MDALRRNALTIWPGMTIFWIGDLAHQGSVSGHNPDDYTGVRAEMLDADTDPEVRALDFMIGSNFTIQDGRDLVTALTKGVDKQRLYYVIYRSTIYRRATGFQAEGYGGDNHNDHVHVSGFNADDANGSDWQSVLALGDEEGEEYVDTHWRITSASDPAFNGTMWVSDGAVRRKIRAPGAIRNNVEEGWPNLVTLTDEDRQERTWDNHLDGVLGEDQEVLKAEYDARLTAIEAKLDAILALPPGTGTTAHTHAVAGTTGPVVPGE